MGLQGSEVDKSVSGTGEIASISLVQGAATSATEHKKQVSFSSVVEEFNNSDQTTALGHQVGLSASVQGAVAFVQEVFAVAEKQDRRVVFEAGMVEDFN